MNHKCELEDDVGCCLEDKDKLWIQEYVTELGMMSGRKYEVTFCPVCGFKLPTARLYKSFLGAIPDSSPDESITRFSRSLSTAIAQMNHNVELIKCFMSSQNVHNQCFLDSDIEFSKEIQTLKRKIKNIEITIGNVDE